MHDDQAADRGCGCPRTADLDGDGSAAAGRRRFLRGAGLLGAGVGSAGLGLLTAGPASAAPKPGDRPSDQNDGKKPKKRKNRWQPDPDARQFTVAVLPDTQYLFDQDRIHPAPLEASVRYVLDGGVNREDGTDDNIVFLAHLGDVTENGLAAEYAEVTKVFGLLDDAGAAYGVLAGNHDVRSSTDDRRGPTPYLETFSKARAARTAGYRSSSPDGYNTCHVFRAGGRDWMLLSLDWRLSDAGFAWANGVIAANPTLPVILTTHELAYADADGKAALSDYGKRLWEKLINGNDQIFLTVNGHYWPPGRTVLKNRAGHDVHVHITNYQDRYYGGAAMLRSYRFDLDRDTIDVSTFSPWVQQTAAEQRNALAAQEAELTSDVDRFSIPIDFERRFAGFAPAPQRPARGPAELLVRDTVAYWRFDGGGGDGTAVGAQQVVKDLAGQGNDLLLRIAPGTPEPALTWSAEHHPDQPGHGSVLFDGKRSPVRGGYLETVPNAPVNRETFERGFTVEAFFKLPANWDSGQSRWSAILSRWGAAGEAGKNGPSTDAEEPIATLSVSEAPALQWCVYPLSQSGSSTCWGHQLPLDRWWHVAVVNDGKLSRMYVEGCEVARNPATPAVGLTTLGRPWMLGGYSYAGLLDKVFHGYVGDVRIVRRALRVGEFMNAR
ncbi:LamG-like jellyroll fold domain-containing protein [Streptomyces sp. FH025]|uniref:LamG-like jellyroll fold domain-containing protein n=1 Tax=Streptomyces sp. FH025 TaxID=2815937 RepID=UPI001A9D460E|nr:LamG-like jellyroll fold domain-containing protein [Streptomyces sp. FH025]MBO1419287.1 Tat pathway signal sequence domain protein [Streptomyces sp. FH025]